MKAAEASGSGAPCAIIDPEFAALIPAPTQQERELLEASLVQDGCREPLVVWQQGSILLDGHNRLEICARLGIPFTTRAITLKDRDAAVLWVLNNQLGRRNLSDIDRISLASKREPLIKAAAAGKRKRRAVVPQKSAEQPPPMESRKEAAAVAKVSHDTYTKGKTILEHGVPELVEAVRNDEVSINAAAVVATIPPDEQIAAVRDGTVREVAKKLRNDRTRNTSKDAGYTPSSIVEAARTVLGGIDIDPASNDIAQKTVQALAHFTKKDDGLTKPWPGRVWLSPPNSIGKFIDKLLAEYACGNTTAAILLVNAQTDAAWFQRALLRADAVAFPGKRIKFPTSNRKPTEHCPVPGQALLYFGLDPSGFSSGFEQFGAVLRGNAAGKEVTA